MPPPFVVLADRNHPLGTTSIDGISGPGIHRIGMALIVGNCDLSRSGGAVTVRVRHLEGKGIDAAVTATIPIRTELHRLAIGSNHNVAARCGAFIAADLRNYHAVEIHA